MMRTLGWLLFGAVVLFAVMSAIGGTFGPMRWP